MLVSLAHRLLTGPRRPTRCDPKAEEVGGGSGFQDGRAARDDAQARRDGHRREGCQCAWVGGRVLCRRSRLKNVERESLEEVVQMVQEGGKKVQEGPSGTRRWVRCNDRDVLPKPNESVGPFKGE